MLDNLRKSLLRRQSWNAAEGDKGKSVDVRRIREGDILTFDQVDIGILSYVSCVVGLPLIHHFQGQQFTAYPLLSTDRTLLCHMIIAGSEQGRPYLALSRTIPEAKRHELCTEDDYKRLRQWKLPQHLYIREQACAMQDWLYMHYEAKITQLKGTTVTPQQEVRSYDYALYTSLREHKALELERYATGEIVIHATVFRPASDIIRIERGAAVSKARKGEKDVMAARQETPEAQHTGGAQSQPGSPAPADREDAPGPSSAPEEDVAVQRAGEGRAFAETSIASLAGLHQPSPASSQASAKQPQSTAEAAQTQTPGKDNGASKAHPAQDQTGDSAKIYQLPQAMKVQGSRNGDGQMAGLSQSREIEGHRIRCNLRMASKLVDEAMRNDMRVSDVIRKALGLNVAETDQIAFDVKLSNRDYKILAERFDLDARQKDQIHELIMEELSHFTGEPVEHS